MQTVSLKTEPAAVVALTELQEAFIEARDAVQESIRTQRVAAEKVGRLRQLTLMAAEHEQVAA